MTRYLTLDPSLIEHAHALSHEQSIEATVTKALEEFIARREQGEILELFGTLDWNPDYDYKSERTRR